MQPTTYLLTTYTPIPPLSNQLKLTPCRGLSIQDYQYHIQQMQREGAGSIVQEYPPKADLLHPYPTTQRFSIFIRSLYLQLHSLNEVAHYFHQLHEAQGIPLHNAKKHAQQCDVFYLNYTSPEAAAAAFIHLHTIYFQSAGPLERPWQKQMPERGSLIFPILIYSRL